MTGDKFTALFGNLIPALSLLLVMVLRLIPALIRKGHQIAGARQSIGRGNGGQSSRRDKLESGMAILSALASWALESGVVTADSMRARGYGLPGRSAFSIFTLTKRDKALLAALSLLGAIVAAGYAAGALSWRYYPSCRGAGLTWTSALCWLSDLALNLIPAILDGKEAAVCRRLQSQI